MPKVEPTEGDKHADDPENKAGCHGAIGGCFRSCHPDPDETEIIAYDKQIKDNSCWFRIPKIYLRFNPIVTIASVIIIWGFVITAVLLPTETSTEFKLWKKWVTVTFTWLYVGSQDVWALFIIVVYFKYGHVKLGKDDDVPEYSAATWFVMLFACGIGVGLFFYGVAEPIWHYVPEGGGNRYIADKSMPDNTLAQIAMNLTFYHWGIHGWVVYCLFGMIMAIVAYRKGLPMTVKSCFYPLIGDKIFGWMGDCIDILSIVTTLFGVCTSLGMGTIQLNTGLNLINPNIPISSITQIIIIWCVTALATMSTLTGLSLGIRRLSEICFGVGMVIMTLVFFLDDTWYILNVFVQSIGYYIQWIIQLGFHTDAFEQGGKSFGGVDRDRNYADGTSDGPQAWMDWWTIFYWGWWISWSPFVGMFIAKISKGRTIREFINGTMTAPIIYAFLWFSIFGGVGIKMERAAAEKGLCCGHNFDTTLNSTNTNLNRAIGTYLCINSTCNPCSTSLLAHEASISTSGVIFMNRLTTMKEFGVTMDDRSITRLSCHSKEMMWFDIMDSYGQLSGFLRIFSIVGIILYFVTSSDSGSFVIDCLAANGDEDPPRGQRVFWSLMEGATASALIYVGGNDALAAVQAVSVVCGLPYTIIICFVCVALWRVLEVDAGLKDPYAPQFKVGMTSVLATPSVYGVGWTIAHFFIAPYSFARTIAHTSDYPRKKCMTIAYTVILAILLVTFVILEICVIVVPEIYAIGWVCYVSFIVAGSACRVSMRNKYNIDGNMIEDIFCGMAYPLMSYQLLETVNYYEKDSKKNDQEMEPIPKRDKKAPEVVHHEDEKAPEVVHHENEKAPEIVHHEDV